MPDTTEEPERGDNPEEQVQTDGHPTDHDRTLEDLQNKLLEAAKHNPAKVSDLASQIKDISSQASLAPRNAVGQTPLHLLVMNNREDTILRALLPKLETEEKNALNEEGESAVYIAAYRGFVNALIILLEAGVDPNITNNRSRTPLHEACWTGRVDTAKILLDHAIQHGVDLNTQDEDGCTPLDDACRTGRESLVRMLLDRGAVDVNCVDSLGHTPLITAARYGHEHVVGHLLETGPNINQQSNNGWTALMCAARYGRGVVVERLLEQDPSINQQNKDGWTALMCAARYGHGAIVEHLLKKDPGIDLQDNNGWTALMCAARYGHGAIVEHLLKKDPDINQQNKDGWTALMWAARYGHEAIVENLLKKGPNINQQKNNGWTALICSSWRGQRAIVEKLLDKGADIDTSDHEKHTALFKASQQGYADIVDLLLEKSNLKITVDDQGRTALHMASFSEPVEDEEVEGWKRGTSTLGEYEKAMLSLLNVPGMTELQTKDGETALHLAASSNKLRRVEILLGKMSDEVILQKDRSGATAFRKAADNDYREVVEIFLQRAASSLRQEIITKDTLVWASQEPGLHGLLRMHLEQQIKSESDQAGATEDWDALELAVYCGDVRLVWELLKVIAPTDKSRKKRNRAQEVLDKSMRLKGPNWPDARIGLKRKPCGEIRDDVLTQTKKKAEGKDDPDFQLDVIRNLLQQSDDYLGISTFVELKKPSPKVTIKPEHRAIITDFYITSDKSGFRQEFKSITEVAYGPGPQKIMDDRAVRTQKINDEDLTMNVLYERYEQARREAQTPGPDEIEDVYGKEFDHLSTFLRRSWTEIPDTRSPSRLMKPQCMKAKVAIPQPPAARATESSSREATDSSTSPASEQTKESEKIGSLSKPNKGKDGKNQGFERVALYVVKEDKENEEKTKYQELLDRHKNETIHGSRTLDEFYYQFNPDKGDNPKDINRRNKDQIVTKELYDDNCDDLDEWILLRVDQLWLWIITPDTLITSTTHRQDGRKDVVYESVFAHLESAEDRPKSVQELAKFIVDICIRTYDRVQEAKPDTTPHSTDENWVQHGETQKGEGMLLTIREIFSNSINKAALKEVEFFENFTKDEENNGFHENGSSTTEPKTSISEPARLLCKIKDLQDELHILRVVVSHQQDVLKELEPGRAGDRTKAAQIIHDIDEMDKYVKRIYTAVNATLSLEQNKLAVIYSNEAVQQGRALVVFTIATVFFVSTTDIVPKVRNDSN
ncbi:hypothetical protein DL766_008540 [Monosporascus sp. MC13-8B]|nr:hypothetical protein DL766_008540 [Monosporascus sp. MC13-8B]